MVFEMSVALHCFAAKELEMSYHNMGIKCQGCLILMIHCNEDETLKRILIVQPGTPSEEFRTQTVIAGVIAERSARWVGSIDKFTCARVLGEAGIP